MHAGLRCDMHAVLVYACCDCLTLYSLTSNMHLSHSESAKPCHTRGPRPGGVVFEWSSLVTAPEWTLRSRSRE